LLKRKKTLLIVYELPFQGVRALSRNFYVETVIHEASCSAA